MVISLHTAVHTAAAKLNPKTRAYQDHATAIRTADPLLASMDALLRYAERHEREFGVKLADDGFCGPLWLDAIKGIRGLLSGPGTFEAGVLEDVFWTALDVAGFDEGDL